MARFAFTPARPGGEEVLIEVTPGQSPTKLAQTLVEKGAVRDADDFILLGRIIRQWGKIKVGEYKVSPSMTPIEVFAVVTSGISAAYRVTVREGNNMFQIGETIEQLGLAKRAEFVALCRDRAFMRSLGL